MPQNYEQAQFWLQKAASQNVYAAEKTLADMYMLGQGTKRDPDSLAFMPAKPPNRNVTWSGNKTARSAPRLVEKSMKSGAPTVERES